MPTDVPQPAVTLAVTPAVTPGVTPGRGSIDALIGNPDVFPVLNAGDYFNHAGISPLPRPVSDAARDYLSAGSVGVPMTFFRHIDAVRERIATFIHAEPAEVAFVQNTGEAVSTYAFGLDWAPGDVIVTTTAEYPTNVYPWLEVQRRHGVTVVRVEEVTRDDGSVEVPVDRLLNAAADPRCRVLAISHVQWASGQRFDLHALGRFCRDRGVLLAVDAIQSLGVFPIDVKAMRIDLLSCGGHKWVLGMPGAGMLYVRRDLLERVRPLGVGWGNVADPFDWDSIDYTLATTARRYEYGTPNVAGIAALGAAIDLLEGAGIDDVAARVTALTDRLVSGLRDAGHHVVSPRPQGCQGPSVAFLPKSGDPADLVKRLRDDHRTELAVRSGRVRVSPHFYNTEEQIDRLLERVG